ncbi:MAG: Formate dehydrogenase chain [Gemmatimonadetes bacterium]|nr:Formate dehydrogenase chain [Gemmatimonadota bacterium]
MTSVAETPAAHGDPAHPMFELGFARPVKRRDYLHAGGAHTERLSAGVAEEIPVALIYNETPHAVMMTTPADLEDFAVGFTLSEQIVESLRDIGVLHVVQRDQGTQIFLEIPDAAAEAISVRSRSLVGRTGCGLCGVQQLSDALRPVSPVEIHEPIDFDAIVRAERGLQKAQRWNRETGARHAAAWASRDGTVRVAREDLGRHNAVDKVIGALARAERDPSDGFLLVTSRASYELVQKAAVARIPLLAAISRPTGLAIRMAECAGMTLVGLLRGESANIYAHPEGIAMQ